MTDKWIEQCCIAGALLAVTLVVAYFGTVEPVLSFPIFGKGHRKPEPLLPTLSQTDLHSDVASAEAVEVAQHLGVMPQIRRLEELRSKMQASGGRSSSLEAREELRDVKEEITESIEQARLEVEFVQAELSVEIAVQSELLQTYSRARDDRVNQTNIWAFRTNGVLWAIAEGLSIPTYRTPRYSIPSGSIGIIAGVVPSVFSAFAVRESSGAGYNRIPYPNMLSQLFDYPTFPRIDYPGSVLSYLRATPAYGKNGESRADWLVDHWADDKNLQVFTDRNSRKQVDVITGTDQIHQTIEVVSDRVTMLQQLSALISQMNRPLLELMMVVRGTKHLPS